MALALRLLRVLIFVICLLLFIWQAYKIVKEYLDKEIATKVSVKTLDNANSVFSVAFCMDEYNTLKALEEDPQDFDYYEDGDSRTILNPNNLQDLDGIESILGENYLRDNFVDLFRNVFEDIDCSVSYTFIDNSRVTLGVENAKSMYHPMLGFCVVFDSKAMLNSTKAVTSVLADAKPRREDFFTQTVKIERNSRKKRQENDSTVEDDGASNNTETDYPDFDDNGGSLGFNLSLEEYPSPVQYSPISGSPSTPLHELRPDLFGNGLEIWAFVQDEFYVTRAGVNVETGSVEDVILRMDVTDKTDVSFHPGEECTDDPIDEDKCLNSCLVRTFVNSTGCVHPRLNVMLKLEMVPKEAGIENVTICDFEALSRMADEPDQNDENSSNSLDPGLSLIKQIINGFTKDLEDRCECPKPCVRRHFEINRWKLYDNTNEQDMQAVLNIDQRFYHFKDTPTFDFVKMLADLGGYLGLMLGYSAYSIADFVEYCSKIRKRKSVSVEKT